MLVKEKKATQDDMDEFVRIVNSSLPDTTNPIELAVSEFFRRFYFSHKPVVKLLQGSKNHNKNMRSLVAPFPPAYLANVICQCQSLISHIMLFKATNAGLLLHEEAIEMQLFCCKLMY